MDTMHGLEYQIILPEAGSASTGLGPPTVRHAGAAGQAGQPRQTATRIATPTRVLAQAMSGMRPIARSEPWERIPGQRQETAACACGLSFLAKTISNFQKMLEPQFDIMLAACASVFAVVRFLNY